MSEVEDFSADFVRDLLDAWMPLTEGSWHVAKDDWDLIVASRWPIDATYPEVYRQYPVLINTGDNGDWMVTASHLKCCNGAEQRQTEADEYMAFLRDAMTPGGEVNLTERTPVVLWRRPQHGRTRTSHAHLADRRHRQRSRQRP